MPRHLHRPLVSRSLERPRRVLLILLAAALPLAACAGGSGSSGFDAVAENNAINDALGSHRCTMNAGVTICASGAAPTPASTATLALPSPTSSRTATSTSTATTTPTNSRPPTASATPTKTPQFFSPTPTQTPAGSPAGSPIPSATLAPLTATLSPTPTGTPVAPTPPASATASSTATSSATGTPVFTPTATPTGPSITTNVDPDDTIPCPPAGSRQSCVFAFAFQPQAAPVDAVYRVAVRSEKPASSWLILPVTDNSASIAIDPAPPTRRYQLAVLLFTRDPGFVPERVGVLAETGADFAFVTPLLTPVRATAGPTS